MRKYFFLPGLILLSIFATAQMNIIPQPRTISTFEGTLNPAILRTIVVPDEPAMTAAKIFTAWLKERTGYDLQVKKMPAAGEIKMNISGADMSPEQYILQVKEKDIQIDCGPAGVMPALQTLLQLFPQKNDPKGSIKLMTIDDYPRFAYRGMHLDVSRHFFPASYVKKYIDYLAMYKYNTFHWHLTDDQGWRIEIKKYPNLITTGAWRNGTIIGRYPGTGNDHKRHGGFYTQQEVKDVVKYAADRGIRIIPEIEMPGHASAALTAYPELGCTGGPYHVQETWGVFEEVFCAGNDKTFEFLQNVLDEVMELFPSSLIHIGGDECPKESWKKCPKCQARMQAEQLKNEHELQSYFIRRIEKYVNSKGRNIIGWDEILEGGLAPNATVMSWRGEEGGIQAAKEKHNVVMTPGSHCYFDHTQSRNEDSVTIGGYTPLEKVYQYEPVPKELDAEQAKYILGAQANLWAEYIDNPRKVEYMIFPRMMALSEVLWTDKAQRNQPDFERRMLAHFNTLNRLGINYSRAYFDLTASVKPSAKPGTLEVKLTTKRKDGLIRHQYQTQLQEAVEGPKTHTEALLINQQGETTVKISAGGWYQFTWLAKGDSSRPVRMNFDFNYATARKITLTEQPSKKYPGEDGANGLVNGLVSERGIASPEWLGWVGSDLEAVIDLGMEQPVSKISVHTLDQNGSWIYLPQYLEVFVSTDGINFTPTGKGSVFTDDKLLMKYLTVAFATTKARYVKVLVKNYGSIPSGKPGAGNKAWLFVDEIKVW